MQNDNKVKDYVSFQIHKSLVNLYKRYLNLIEDIQEDHKSMLEKLNNKIDSNTLKNIDYFDNNRYNYLRKKILDIGNESIREIEKNFDFIKMEFKNENEKYSKIFLMYLFKRAIQILVIYTPYSQSIFCLIY
jgi:hypothetical protein